MAVNTNLSSYSRQNPPDGENTPESSIPNVLLPTSRLEPPNHDLIKMRAAEPSTRPTVSPLGPSGPPALIGPSVAPDNEMPLPPPPGLNLNCEKTRFFLKTTCPTLKREWSDGDVYVPTSLTLSEDDDIIAKRLKNQQCQPTQDPTSSTNNEANLPTLEGQSFSQRLNMTALNLEYSYSKKSRTQNKRVKIK